MHFRVYRSCSAHDQEVPGFKDDPKGCQTHETIATGHQTHSKANDE